jgi:hypothetical protein
MSVKAVAMLGEQPGVPSVKLGLSKSVFEFQKFDVNLLKFISPVR